MITCEWFAKCTNTTTEGVRHPALGIVPICKRCQEKMSTPATHALEPA
jgi:hypothetical protein